MILRRVAATFRRLNSLYGFQSFIFSKNISFHKETKKATILVVALYIFNAILNYLLGYILTIFPSFD